MNTVPDHLYRFRSTRALLGGPNGHDELRKQEFRFSAPHELNDPMEGYKDFFWHGDRVLWRNLFRNYVESLFLTMIELHLRTNADGDWDTMRVHISRREIDPWPPQLVEKLRRVSAQFVQDVVVGKVIDELVELNRPLRREALEHYLWMTHFSALRIVSAEHPVPVRVREAFAKLATLIETSKWFELPRNRVVAEHLDAILESATGVNREMRTAFLYNIRGDAGAWKHGFVFDFPARYIAELVRVVVHPQWYTVCFSSSAENASFWGTYGDGHKGVALKFKAANGRLSLTGVNGTNSVVGRPSQVTSGVIPVRFRPVQYSERLPEMDFFASMGSLPIGVLQEHWWSDPDVGKSTRCTEVGSDGWRERYWEQIMGAATTKLQDWAFEQEYRLVREDLLGVIEANRFARYDFDDLAGIVFGLRTSTKEKFQIIEIIERKCREARKDTFDFSQAVYSRRTGKISIENLRLGTFK